MNLNIYNRRIFYRARKRIEEIDKKFRETIETSRDPRRFAIGSTILIFYWAGLLTVARNSDRLFFRSKRTRSLSLSLRVTPTPAHVRISFLGATETNANSFSLERIRQLSFVELVLKLVERLNVSFESWDLDRFVPFPNSTIDTMHD